MISVEEAISKVESNIDILETEFIALKNSLGRVVNENIISPINMPPFKQSAMDGYAINFDPHLNSYQIIDEIQAGMDPADYKISKGEAVRIFTGAAIPKGSTSVIQQEWCKRTNNTLTFNKKPLDNLNIRPIGEQLKKGEIIVQKEHQITPATIGLIAGLGIENVSVYMEPNVAIIITGNELVKPGSKLTNGKIFESNSSMLTAVLNQYGYKKTTTLYAKDDYTETVKVIDNAMRENDIVIMSGGISVGNYDFVLAASTEIGVEKIFHKVKQKPGKPLYFGKKDKKAIFGLPGNPGATLTCFYIYVLRYLSLITKKPYPIKVEKAQLSKSYLKKGFRAEFLKAKINNGSAIISSHQNSSMLRSFSEANGLVYIREELEEVNESNELLAYLLL